MYYYIVQALKRRIVLELQDSFGNHPIYDKVVPHIQNKYAFDERPQFGIIVKGSSANKVSLSADNFKGTVHSFVMLAYVGPPAFPLEWVREDLSAIRANGETMPTAPGIYYIEILTVPTTAQDQGSYVIDPLREVINEPVLHFITGIEHDAQLQFPPVQGTLRLWENRDYLLIEGKDYTVNYSSGAIALLTRFNPQAFLSAAYYVALPSIGPIPFVWNTADFKALPGVVLAFGKRARVGDKVAVRVYADRVETASATGGLFEATFELDVMATDPIQMEEMADFALMSLWSTKRPILSTEGIEITDISMGGETEEQRDEQADLFYYTANLSVSVQAEWEVHVPLPLTVSRVTPTTAAQDQTSMVLDPATATTISGNTDSRLFFATVPIIAGRNNSFERIT